MPEGVNVMADSRKKDFDLTKDLSDKDRATIARNLMHIERMKQRMTPVSSYGDTTAAERRIAQEREASERRITQERDAAERRINQEREESERRILREREESERRITEEQERRARLEEEWEESRAKLRADIEAAHYNQQVRNDQDILYRRMAVSYTEYDPSHELCYYYDDRGTYIDTAAARGMWQRIHCKSYTTYDPADTFWEFFLDKSGNIITRDEAFTLWQPEHCPGYLNYEPDGIWTLYRCGDGFISSSEAKERWLREKADSTDVKYYICSGKTEEIAGRLPASFEIPLPDSKLRSACKPLSAEIDRINTLTDHLTAISNCLMLIFVLILLAALILFCIGHDSFTESLLSKDYLNKVKSLTPPLAFFSSTVSLILAKIAKKKTALLERKEAQYNTYIRNCDEVTELVDNVSQEIKNALEQHMALARSSNTLPLSILTGSNISRALLRLVRSVKAKSFPKKYSYDYHVVEAEITRENIKDEATTPLIFFLLTYSNLKRYDFTDVAENSNIAKTVLPERLLEIDRDGKYIVDIVYLSSDGAQKLSDMISELGIRCKIRTRSVTLLEKG